MIEFVVVNKQPFRDIIMSEIALCMNDLNISLKDYIVKDFKVYDESFLKEINKKTTLKKIYILDFEINNYKIKHSILRKIKNNNPNSEIILTTISNINSLAYLSIYTFKILSETNMQKFQKQIYTTIKNLNSYNEFLLKLNIKENKILQIIDIDDIESITKNKIYGEVNIKVRNLKKEITAHLDYNYLKRKLPNNFQDICDNKLINTDYINIDDISKNLIVISKPTRQYFKNEFKKEIVRKYTNGIINNKDLETLGISIQKYKTWEKLYKNENIINIKVEIINRKE